MKQYNNDKPYSSLNNKKVSSNNIALSKTGYCVLCLCCSGYITEDDCHPHNPKPNPLTTLSRQSLQPADARLVDFVKPYAAERHAIEVSFFSIVRHAVVNVQKLVIKCILSEYSKFCKYFINRDTFNN